MFNTLMKKNGKKGFTLMELLIVVAIIAILVAISIPVFSTQLDKARESTDEANERAAKAAAVVQYLTDETTGDFYYDADAGELVETATKPTGYGKTSTNKDKVIKVTVAADGGVTLTWEDLKNSD